MAATVDTTKLVFNTTQSIARFKAVNNIESLKVITNPHTQKDFFTCPEDSNISGKISAKINYTLPIDISEVADANGAVFLLMHNHAENDTNVKQTL